MSNIYEIGGYIPSTNIQNNTLISSQINHPIQNNRSQDSPNMTSVFDDWQNKLYNLVIQGKDDLLVNVNPAGGKTSPIVEAWKYMLKHGQPKRIVWITPTIQLANQIYYQDLRSSFTNIIMELLNTRYGRYIFPHIQDPSNISPNEFNQLNSIINKELLIFRAGGSSAKGSRISNRTVAVTCTYPYASSIIQKLKPHIVIIDEMQEYIPINVGIDTSDTDAKADLFIEAIKSISRQTQLILLTGSMNLITSQQLIGFMNWRFHRKFKKPFIANAPNRASISVIPHDKLRTATDIKNIVKRAVYNKDIGNACVLFSVKSIDFVGKKAIMPIANELLKELPQRSIKQTVGSDAELINNSVKDYYGKLPISRHEQNNIIQNEIPRISGLKTSAKDAISNITSDHKNPKWQASWLQYMLNQEGKPVPRDPNTGMPGKYPDPFLAKCILCGFGYMAGGKDRDRGMHAQDIRLVQSLFEQGKIYFLLASDMIGVGTTLVVRKLYIPTLTKYQNHIKGMGKVDDSSLIQLINRVGRKGDLSASIYCDKDDVSRVYHLINNSPHSTVQPAIFGYDNSSLERQSENKIIKTFLQIMQ